MEFVGIKQTITIGMTAYQAYLLYKQAEGCYAFCESTVSIGCTIYSFLKKKEVDFLTHKELHEVEKEYVIVGTVQPDG